jgi:hypothetical protein
VVVGWITGIGLLFWFLLPAGLKSYFIEGYVRTRVLTGEVVEHPNGAGVAQAKVWIVRGKGGLSWSWMGSHTTDSTRTDALGRYRLRYALPGGGTGRLYCSKPGYAPFHLKHVPESPLTIRIARLSSDARDVTDSQIHIRTGYGEIRSVWDFAENRMAWKADTTHGGTYALDLDSADVAFDWTVNSDTTIQIRSFGQGGVLFVPRANYPANADLGALLCIAPEDGYAQAVRIHPRVGSGFCFVRTRDGSHYARFEFDAEELIRMAVQRQHSRMRYPSWYNHAGGRGLCIKDFRALVMPLERLDFPQPPTLALRPPRFPARPSGSS